MADATRGFQGVRWSAAAALLAIAVTAGGCRTAPRVDEPAGTMPAVTLRVEHGDGRLALYETGPGGVIRFAGGADVSKERYSWEGVLQDDEREALMAILDRHGLFEADSRRAADGPGPQYRVTIRRSGRRHRFTADGTDPGVVELHDLLRDAAARRFDPIVERWSETAGGADRE